MRKRKYFLRMMAVTVLVLLFAVGMAGCTPKRITKETEGLTLGVDVARYQGTINWQTLAQSEIDFAIVRLGYRGMSDGEITEDSNARYNLQEGSKAGIPLGAYFFSTAITEEEAVAEAEWAAQLMAKYPITYPVVYDCEGFLEPDSRQYGMTKEARTKVALAFLKTIEKLGYEGMFYASKYELETQWEMGEIEKNYKIWVAQYPDQPYPGTPESSYDGIHHMWQYSKEGMIDGIRQPVDLNVAYFGYDGIEPARDQTPAEEVGPDVEAMMDFDDVNEQVTAKESTNLRSIPSQDTDSQVLDQLLNGEVAQRISISSSGWSKLLFEGNTYYAVSSYLTTDLNYSAAASAAVSDPDGDGFQTKFNNADELVTAKELTNLRNMPSATREDSKVLFELKHGDVAVCTGISDNGWARLEYDGTTCYAKYNLLMPYSGGTAGENVGMEFTEVADKVTPTKSVNLRTVPNTASDDSIVVKVHNGEILHRIGINEQMQWSKVLYHGQILYCSSMYLTSAE